VSTVETDREMNSQLTDEVRLRQYYQTTMSENTSDTMDEQNSDSEQFTIAVIAAEGFGAEMEKNERAQKVIEVIRNGVEEIDEWERPDEVAYTSDLTGTGNAIKVALKAYNSSMAKKGHDDEVLELGHIETPWNDTEGKDEDELGTRPDGTKYVENAGEVRNKAMEMVSDGLVVLGDDGLTGRVIGRFRRNGKEVHQYQEIDQEFDML
jgi:hypothetical protein